MNILKSIIAVLMIVQLSVNAFITSFSITQRIRQQYSRSQLNSKLLFKQLHNQILITKCINSKSDVQNLSQNVTLQFSQIKPFLNIAGPFFKEDKTARNSLFILTALTLANSGISVAFSYVSRDFYNALNTRDETEFYMKIQLFFIYLLIATPISVYYRFIREKLQLYWRETLTEKILNKYFSYRMFYELETLRDIDNPDQRIAEDVRALTRTSLDFFITIFTSIIDLFSFSAILYNIYPGLFFAIIAYAGIGSLITTKLGQNLVQLNYERLLREANFRFSLIRTRENAESIAFYDTNGTSEKNNLITIFETVIENQFHIIKTQRNLEFFTTSYRYLVQILPSLIVAPLYFAKKVELGTISQSYGAFNHILSDFSIIINQFEALSAFSAGLTRLSVFLNRIDQSYWTISNETNSYNDDTNDFVRKSVVKNDNRIQITSFHIVDNMNVPYVLNCQNLTVYTPDGTRTIVGDIIRPQKVDSLIPIDDNHHQDLYLDGIDVTIMRGDRVLIVGPSGCGKSSFIRAISGLWSVGYGNVTWYTETARETVDRVQSAIDGVFFLPQKPYNILGTLRDQIMYPSGTKRIKHVLMADEGPVDESNMIEDNVQDQYFLEILKSVKLDSLALRSGDGNAIVGLNTVQDWSKVLSMGEQQRLAFARVLYNHPRVVILDEATSALDLFTEEAMYKLLMDLKITFISVGHRPSLLRYHNRKLVLQGPKKPSYLIDVEEEEASKNVLVDITSMKATVETSEI